MCELYSVYKRNCNLVVCFFYSNSEIWDEDEDELDAFVDGESLSEVEPKNTPASVLVRWLSLFIHHLQIKHFLPDAAIEALLKFLYAMFVVLGTFSDKVKEVCEHLPHTVYSFGQYSGTSHFEHYVLRPNCNSVRPAHQCVQCRGVSKLCDSQELQDPKV